MLVEQIPEYVYYVSAIATSVVSLTYIGRAIGIAMDGRIPKPPKVLPPKPAVGIVATTNVGDVKGLITNVRWFYHD